MSYETIRTTIRQTETGTVVLTYQDEADLSGAPRVREFTTIGRDVREYDSRGGVQFVGARLANGGWSLPVGRDGLLATIRREYRAMRRAEAARWAAR
jgi:hypothetical protein